MTSLDDLRKLLLGRTLADGRTVTRTLDDGDGIAVMLDDGSTVRMEIGKNDGGYFVIGPDIDLPADETTQDAIPCGGNEAQTEGAGPGVTETASKE
jgi:hypothetical protein